MSNIIKPKVFIIDVDGVMTTGHFLYSTQGKVMKIFGPDDNDALSLISSCLGIHFVTGDKTGYDISRQRIVHDMGYQLDLVSTIKRVQWMEEHYNLAEAIYMGDGIFDHYVMDKVGYSIAPANGHKTAKDKADFITLSKGGDRAVAEACLHILEKFFEAYDPNQPIGTGLKLSGIWSS